MISFGISTGTLHKFNVPLIEKLRVMRRHGANAVELVLILPETAYNFELTPELRKGFEAFDYVSIHAPFIMPSITQGASPFQRMAYTKDDTTKRIYEKLESVANILNATAVVFHPNTVKEMSLLDEYNFTVAMENMDKNKPEGINPEYFETLNIKYKFKYVLDLHHIFTHDSTMQITNSYLEAMGNRLQHLHISGQSGVEGHLPINLAENKNEIMKYASKIQKPMILEGTFAGLDLNSEIKNELTFVKKALGNESYVHYLIRIMLNFLYEH